MGRGGVERCEAGRGAGPACPTLAPPGFVLPLVANGDFPLSERRVTCEESPSPQPGLGLLVA